MRIEEVHLDLIKPYWRNPRNIEDAVEYVRASIERYGYTVPIIVDEKFVIISGHARYRALRLLKWEKIKVVVAVGLSAEKITEFRIADNKTSEFARWDTDKLREELLAIGGDDLRVFFSDSEWASMIPETLSIDDIKAPTDTDAFMPEPEPLPAARAGAEGGDGPRPPDPEQKMAEVLCPCCGKPNEVPTE